MYILDTTAFYVLGNYYPSRFPSIWEHINNLVKREKFWSVKEVRQEIEHNCPFEHIEQWVDSNRHIFRKPTSSELEMVRVTANGVRSCFVQIGPDCDILSSWHALSA